MEVILLERIAKLGQMGQTVKVRDGYARNYLLPAGKALRANAANKARFEAERSVLEARNLERKNEAQEVADVLAGKSFIAVRAAGETGQLYGSVAARDVVEILSAEGFNISRNQVVLNAPIKTVGVHEVEIHLHAEVEISIELNVARTTEEAERQAKGEDLTSAEAIYGVDEDALRPEDFFNPDADYDIEDEQEEASAEAEEAGEEEEEDK